MKRHLRTRPGISSLLPLLVAAACVACAANGPTAERAANVTGDFEVRGDAAAATGATWSYRGEHDGVRYELDGVLFRPAGDGPFPAVVISHGAGGNANAYARQVAAEMVRWGIVCIGTNYTHAGGVALGAPGRAEERGASTANVLRAHRAYELLRTLGYVDMTRVAAHGHSMGAFVTAALVGAYPGDFRAASHTAGGLRQGPFVSGPAPGEEQLRGIRTPYQIHHGDADAVVPVAMDIAFDALLTERGVVHELHIYPGGDHALPARNALMFERVRNWYTTHGVLR